MRNKFLALSLILILLAGCVTRGEFPYGTGTSVNLEKKNYRIMKTNVIGTSSGFKLFGFITIMSPRYIRAMSKLYTQAGISEGGAYALTNVVQEKSSLYLLLFSIPTITVRADIVEFLEEIPPAQSK